MDTILTDKIYLNVDDEMYLGLSNSVKKKVHTGPKSHYPLANHYAVHL